MASAYNPASNVIGMAQDAQVVCKVASGHLKLLLPMKDCAVSAGPLHHSAAVFSPCFHRFSYSIFIFIRMFHEFTRCRCRKKVASFNLFTRLPLSMIEMIPFIDMIEVLRKYITALWAVS